jgi:hypothetical protein
MIRKFSYDAIVNAELEKAISPTRLSPYRIAIGGDLQAALDLYVWNVGAAAALYGPLQILEVTFRNAMNREMRNLFGASWPTNARFSSLAGAIRNRPARVNGFKPPDLRKGPNQAARDAAADVYRR